jgi:hypothetical protein
MIIYDGAGHFENVRMKLAFTMYGILETHNKEGLSKFELMQCFAAYY